MPVTETLKLCKFFFRIFSPVIYYNQSFRPQLPDKIDTTTDGLFNWMPKLAVKSLTVAANLNWDKIVVKSEAEAGR